ncbi:MAG: hypothetical protein CVT61_11130 [Actinobacteria bacterium HGW-Actinobacteria-11]|nr:MAG: hypothetical protein CVT61_11130 [Actinobacteria bacterium HGW-Actinobacteria-11]
MTASPKGYPFERIDYDVGQLNSLHGHLEDAAAEVAAMQLVLRNVTDNLEGRGQALDQAKAMAGDVAAAFASPAARIRRIKDIVLAYGQSAEEHGARANQLMDSVTAAEAAVTMADADLADAQTELSTWQRSEEHEAWSSGEDVATPARTLRARDEGYRDAMETAQTGRAGAASDLEEAWAAWERAFESWDDAYARAVAALASVGDDYVSAADAAALASLADADSPAEVAAIWDTLTDAQKEHYVEAYPGFIGNLEGVPYAYRIAANVKTLEEAAAVERGEPLDTTIDRLLAELRRGGVPVSLNLFDKNQVTAAILYVDGFTYVEGSFADPLTGVTNVNVLIGGMMSEAGQIRDWSQSARDLNEVTDGRSATIAWFGYDTPNFATVGSSEQARIGAELLTNALRGLDLVAPPGATTTVIAHSYGTTTAFLAVGSASDVLGVDNLISLGSAGLTNQALGGEPERGLDFAGTNLFTTRGPNDWVSLLGRTFSDHTIDPDSIEGVTTFQSDGGTLPDGTYLEDTPGHGTHSEANLPIGAVVNDGGYLQDGSESFANIANIINYGEPLTTDDR